MRISVCEFLRLKTNRNWFYVKPGHWASDRWEYTAQRDPEVPDELMLYKGKRKQKTLVYFEGIPSHVVRDYNRRK